MQGAAAPRLTVRDFSCDFNRITLGPRRPADHPRLRQSRTNGGLGELPLLKIDAYALLDLRAGIKSDDGTWRFSIWGRNVTNKYYWTTADHIADTTVRYTGKPATYGATLSVRFN